MDESVYDEQAHCQDENWWFVGRRRILATVIERLNLPPGAAILEVGCATGGNLLMLSRFGRVEALEPHGPSCQRARARCPAARVHQHALPDPLPVVPASFHLLCLLDVLEHLDDDHTCLTLLRGCLRPDGRVLITVPAYPALFHEHDRRHHHRRRYSRRGLGSLLADSGFATQFLGHFNTLLAPIVLAARLVERVNPAACRAANFTPFAPVNRLMACVFALERHLAGRIPVPCGISLLAVATPA